LTLNKAIEMMIKNIYASKLL